MLGLTKRRGCCAYLRGTPGSSDSPEKQSSRPFAESASQKYWLVSGRSLEPSNAEKKRHRNGPDCPSRWTVYFLVVFPYHFLGYSAFSCQTNCALGRVSACLGPVTPAASSKTAPRSASASRPIVSPSGIARGEAEGESGDDADGLFLSVPKEDDEEDVAFVTIVSPSAETRRWRSRGDSAPKGDKEFSKKSSPPRDKTRGGASGVADLD